MNLLIFREKKNENIGIVSWVNKLFPFYVSCILFVFYGLNDIVDLMIIVAFFGCSIVLFLNKNLEMLYFPLIFFEAVLVLPIGGSFFRIYEVVYFAYILYKFRGKIKSNYRLLLILIFSIMSLAYAESLSGVLSVFLNGIIFYTIVITDNLETHRNDALYAISVSAVSASLYSFLHAVGESYGYGIRYCGTINDPNYFALLLIIGFFATLFNSFMDNKARVLASIVLLVGLFRTISLSGIITIVVVLMVILYVKNRQKGFLVATAVVLVCFAFISFELPTDFFLYGIQYRVRSALSMIETKNYAAVSSGRTRIVSEYIDKYLSLPFMSQLLGGNNTIGGSFRDSMVSIVGTVSHNSYIDILFMNGAVGLVFIASWLIWGVIKNVRRYLQQGEQSCLGVAAIKLSVMIMSFTISIYTYKYYNIALWM